MTAWLVAHLVAVAVLTGVGWVVQAVVYPAFALVGRGEWAAYHQRHLRSITRVVTAPWLVQGVSAVALLVAPPAVGGRTAAAVLAVVAVIAVAATVAGAVPVHTQLAGPPDAAETAALLRANLVRTLAWTGSTALAAVLLVRQGC